MRCLFDSRAYEQGKMFATTISKINVTAGHLVSKQNSNFELHNISFEKRLRGYA